MCDWTLSQNRLEKFRRGKGSQAALLTVASIALRMQFSWAKQLTALMNNIRPRRQLCRHDKMGNQSRGG